MHPDIYPHDTRSRSRIGYDHVIDQEAYSDELYTCASTDSDPHTTVKGIPSSRVDILDISD